MTVLLLTDLPPSTNFTAGLVTAQMARAVLPDPLAIFCVLNRHLIPELAPDLEDVPKTIVPKPNEVGVRSYRSIHVGTLGAVAIELARRVIHIPSLVQQAVEFGRFHRVTRLWAVLQGQTMVRMALPVAQRLGVPLHLHVWDPLRWWHQAHLVDPINAWLDMRTFDRTMRAGVSCASASWAMSDHFAQRYGIVGEPIISALDQSWGRRPDLRLRAPGELVIGVAGQFYAKDEWFTLVQALTMANWRVDGRRVVLRVMGREPPPGDIPPENLDFKGWRSQQEVVEVLSEGCDVLYCGYPFATAMEEVSRLSFPSKLTTYFCAGRPVLFHGRANSSPGQYLQKREAALIAGQFMDGIYNSLLHFAEDAALYRRLAEASSRAFFDDFTVERQRHAVRRFLRLEQDLPREPLISPGPRMKSSTLVGKGETWTVR